MAHYMTSNNSSGKAVFDKTVSSEHNPVEVPFGKVTTVYAAGNLPANVNDSQDLNLTRQCRDHGLPNGRVTIDNGIGGAIVSLSPGIATPMHRTRTLDIGVILEGEVEWELDSGEKKRLKAGDTITQRGTTHRWTNITPNDGWVKMFFVGVDAATIMAGGKELPEEWN